MSNKIYYDTIMNIPGLDEVQTIVKKWNSTLSNLKNKNVNTLQLLPNLLLKSKSGAGKTNFCKILSDYLDSWESIDFYGDVKFFEFYFSYCAPERPLGELTRFIEELNFVAGYRNEYRGLISIDLTRWIEHMKEQHFLLFLDYISVIDARCCIVFHADDMTDAQAKDLEKILSAFCRIRTAAFPYPSQDEFLEYIVKMLKEYEFHVEESGKELIRASIGKLMNSEYFDGYKTMNRLCLDLSYELMARADVKHTIVTAKDLAYFSKEGDFIKTLYTTPRIKGIGFDPQ